ncbi:endonuclease/exonuclease/phosphatase family protein [Planctomycetota bacterium]
MRVLAYNIKHGRGNDGKVDLERTASVIRRLHPDVVALQEIDNKATRSGKIDEAKRLGELTGLKYHAFGRFMDFQGGGYGMAIISKYPLSDVTDLRLPEGAEPRTSLIATVNAPQPFRLASVHFYATEPQRLAQAKTLLEFLDDRQDLPCIIAGDFNSKPDSPVLKLFSDWNIPDKGDDHFTFSSDKPKIEIDFILHRPDTAFVVREIDVIDEPIASDHRPLIADLSVVPERQARWWKGNLHTHSLWSDGNDFPEMIADWYRQRGYHFLAISDHNVLSEGPRWMKLTAIESRNGKTALPKYLARFGKDWVETRGKRSDGSFEVRLKPLSEFRTLVESAGEFLMIQSEEITDKGAHINATNIAELIQPQGGKSVRETIQNNLRAIDAQAKRLGRTIIPHLNHPNLGDEGISAEDLAALVQDEFFEVFNGVDQDGDLGSDRRHSLETLWDITSTLRLSEFGAAPMFALATDDSHEYHGKTRLAPGRGWIMLRAKFLSSESIVNAMKRGDFYASSGVLLNRIEFDRSSKTLSIEIEPDGDAEFTTQFIGTPVTFDKTTTQRKDEEGNAVEGTLDYSSDVGKVFANEKGLKVRYQLTGDELFVRAAITSNKAPDSPTSESPLEKAWTQPIGWRARLAQ